jgi:prevent-host-death family protein
MATRISTQATKSRLAEHLRRAAAEGERFLIERRGKPVAALVSVEDLKRLEAWEAAQQDDDPERQAAFRRALADMGVRVHWPSGTPVDPADRVLIEVPGPPLSEQIIADRR